MPFVSNASNATVFASVQPWIKTSFFTSITAKLNFTIFQLEANQYATKTFDPGKGSTKIAAGTSLKFYVPEGRDCVVTIFDSDMKVIAKSFVVEKSTNVIVDHKGFTRLAKPTPFLGNPENAKWYDTEGNCFDPKPDLPTTKSEPETQNGK